MLNPVAIIGSGTMGHGIAQICAQGGLNVTLVDQFPTALDNARAKIARNVQQLIENGMFAETTDYVLERIVFSTDLQAVAPAAIIIEAIPEKFDLKQQLYQQLERICRSDAILASNTSGIPITRIASTVGSPERVIGTHFYMPAQLIPLVEVITTDRTSPGLLAQVMDFLAAVGKKPVHVKKDVPAFIGNRLQHAIAREAMSLVQKGVATAEDIDIVVKDSLALRLVFSGPLEQRDLNGLDTHIAITKYLYPDLEDAKEPLPILSEKVAKGELGLKTGRGFYDWTGKDPTAVTGQKNQQLMDLLKFLRNR